jgi:hypothetical protein
MERQSMPTVNEPAHNGVKSRSSGDELPAATRLPMFIAVAVAAVIAVGGGTWFALRPVAAPPKPSKLLPSPYSPFSTTTNMARNAHAP